MCSASRSPPKYWSSTESRRNDMEGWVSLSLTAVAALAWDRGLRFRVESDYLPWSWVTGELFQAPAAS
ncbi:Imm49 family immunity protein [Gemmata obscuriglobus]|nr:Imm49 family immunity protein [Gemmata obscuriglobus]